MDRWSGILKVPLLQNSNIYYRVAASLCLASSKILSVPSTNVIFFNGDRVEGTGNAVIERLSDPLKIAEILVSKFGSSVNAWVVEAPIFNGPFAVYKDFIPSVNDDGEPKSYDPTGFPASTSITLLLSNCFKEVKYVILGKQKTPYQGDVGVSSSCKPKTVVLGFSKGGTVLNQLITELSFSEIQPAENTTPTYKSVLNRGLANSEEDQILPSSQGSFVNSIAEIHYVDVGLNTEGAYLTDPDVIERLSQRLVQRSFGIRFLFHGTPRQWCDGRRIWILKEKDKLVQLLISVTPRSMGKLHIRERLYFPGMSPNLQMHFEIIEKLDVS